MKLIIWTLFLVFNLTLAINLGSVNPNALLKIQGSANDTKNYEFPVSNAGDVNGDGKDDFLIGAYGTDDKESAYLIYGTSDLTPINIDFRNYAMTPASASVGVRFQQAANWDGFGQSLSSAGDIDGDGFDDIVIGANRKSAFSGYAYIIYGGQSLPALFNMAATNLDPKSTGFRVMSAESEYQLGWAVSSAGRFNDDRFDDIAIGVRQYGSSKSKKGAVFVVYGGERTSRSNINFKADGTFDVSGAGFVIFGAANNDYFGHSVANAGDINKDGYNDIVVGAPYKDSNKGVVYVFYGGPKANLANIDLKNTIPASRGFSITGSAADDYFGWSVSSAGDVNKDGYADIIIGASGKDNGKGMAYIIYGSSSPPSINIASLDPGSTGFTVKGAAADDQLGYSVGSVSDLNKDGKSEVIIGANGQGGSNKGAVYVIYGGSSSHIDLASTTLDPTKNGFMISRDTVNGNFGFSVASGDFDGDNKPELFVGTSVKSLTVNAGYVLDLSNMCADGCAECWIPTMCDACLVNYQLMSSTQCKACKIGTGEYYSPAKTCEPCMSHCDTCQNSDSCDICSNTFGYQDTTCITCPDDGKFLSGYLCRDCRQDCKKCSSQTTCNECYDGFGVQNDACISCPQPGKFQDGVRCTNCLDNCDECSNVGTCTKCYGPYGRWDSNTKCIECPTSGKFKLGEDCIDCLPNCDVCSEKATCESCKEDFGRWNFNTECIECPQTGKFLDNGECFDCIGNCDICSNNKTCTTCSEHYGRWNESTECIECPQTGKFLLGGECFDCIKNCDECTDGTICGKCLPGFGHLDGKCVECPPTFYLINGNCEKCIKDCDHCSDSKTCDACSRGYGLLNSICISCPIQMYLSNDGKCEDCIPNCDVCSGSSSCNNCSSDYGLLNSRCVKCPTGMFLSPDGQCLACSPNCNQCSNSTSCQVCQEGYGVLNSKCFTNPQEGLYLSNGTFLACSEGCSQCADSSVCQVCADDYMLTEWNTCVEKKEESGNVGSSSTFEGASLIGAAFSSGGSLPFNFGLVSKMVRNVKYLNISVSADLRQSFVSWTATSSFLKAPESWNSESETRSRILQEVFGRYGLEPAFLINYWKTLILTLVGVVLFGIFKVIEVCFTKENTKGHSVARLINIAASNFALTQFYSNLDDVVLYLVIDARSAKLDTSFGATSFTIGIILLVIGGVALGAHIWLLRKYQGLKRRQAANEFKAFRSKSQNVDLLFKDFKDMGYSTQSFLLVYLVRCIVASLIFAMLFDYPFLQIIMLLILNTCMMIFLVVVRPFKDFFDTCGQVFSEFILLLVNLCMFILAIFDQVGTKPLEAIDKLSSCVIILNLILLVGCAIFLVISVLRLLYNLNKIYQDKKKTKSTSKTLSSLTKKLDQLKHTQNTDRKTSGFEHGSDTQHGLQSEDISDSNMGLNGQQSFHSRINTQFFYTEQGQMLTQQQHHQTEERFDTENLDFSGFFVEKGMMSRKNVRGGAQMTSSEMKKFKGEVEDIEGENMERSAVWSHDDESLKQSGYLTGKNHQQPKNGGGEINP